MRRLCRDDVGPCQTRNVSIGERPGDDASESFERAFAAARPARPQLARRLRLREVLHGVLGVERAAPAIDGFALERQVGAGGMGVVFRGVELATGRAVAIKLVDRSSQHGALDRERFAREAHLLRALRHQGLANYLAHGTTADDQDYLVMEWIEGENLGARLQRGPLDVRSALRLGLEVARTMAEVHAADILHRDLKPANLMLADGRVDDVRVIDFGIARSAAVTSSKLTATGAVVGTPHYMAPEQLQGRSELRTDVYGLGATLFEALARRPVFVGEHPGAVMLAVLAEAPPSLSALRPELPGAVDALVGRMLAKDPRDRPADMSSVATELAQLLRDLERDHSGVLVLSRAERLPRARVGEVAEQTIGTVGRDRQLLQVAGLLAEVADEQRAELVAITGERGSGKSHLLDAIAASATEWSVHRLRARRDDARVPFSTLRALIAQGRASSDEGPLGALLHSPDRRIDPMTYGDRVMLAWLDHAERWTSRGPTLLVIDDADLADASSMRLVDRAMSHLAMRAFVVLISTTSSALPAVGRSDRIRQTRIPLAPLGDQAALRLATSWVPSAEPAQRQRAVMLAAGNPAHLRELCRAVARGETALDARSVSELVWAQFSALSPELRRVLRAASIVGSVAWGGAIATLLGVAHDDPALSRWLEQLVAAGHLRSAPRSRVIGEQQFELASELVYLAAYDLNNDADRRNGHRAIARWYATHLPEDVAARARHLDGAGEHGEAARYHLAAAHDALAGGDRAVLDDCLAHVNTESAPSEVVSAALVLGGHASFWRGELRDALAASNAARPRIAPGSADWFDAASLGITAAGQLGDHASLWPIADEVMATTAVDEAAAQRRVIAICRAASQLTGTSDRADALRAQIASLDLDAATAEARAWKHRAELLRANSRGFDEAIETVAAAHQAHVEHGDLRSAALMGIYACSFYVWSGGFERARTTIDDALRIARRLEVSYLELWGAYAEAKLLVETATVDEALAALERVIAGAESSPRIRAGAHVYAALAAARAGRHDLAIMHSERADAAHTAPNVRLAAAAVRARSLLATGRIEAAASGWHPHAAAAIAVDRHPEFDELIRLAGAEIEVARGSDEASALCVAAFARVRAQAATLGDPLHRGEYLARPHLVVATLALPHAQSL